VGDGPAEAPRGGKGTQGGSVERRVDGEEGSGRPAWRVARGGGRRQRMWEKIGEGESLMGGAAWHSTGAQSNEFDSNSYFKRI
jgi:hypothetical protein